MLAAISLTPGICEELFFRGLLLSSFQRQMGAGKSVLVTALLFAIMHLQFPNLAFHLVMGLILGFIVIRTGCIFVAMVAHITNNGIAILAGVFFQGTQWENILGDPFAHLPLIWLVGAGLVFALGVWLLAYTHKPHT
jgi:membrane protease YdiL (CAAX protease family)